MKNRLLVPFFCILLITQGALGISRADGDGDNGTKGTPTTPTNPPAPPAGFEGLGDLFNGLMKGLMPMMPGPPVPGGPADQTGKPEGELAKRVAELQKMLKLLQATDSSTTPGGRPSNLSLISSPSAVRDLVDHADALVASDKTGALARVSTVQDIYGQAIAMLYMGRGITPGQKMTGWYATREKGRETGLPELYDLIGRGRLDVRGKAAITGLVTNFDFTDSEVRKSRGFPPTKEFLNDATKQGVIEALSRAPTAETYRSSAALLGNAPTLEDLIRDSSADEGTKKFLLEKFLPSIQENMYDKSVATMNDPDKEFIDYYGREWETDRIIDTLSRIEKGHFILTGKAGVGKTTILKILQDGFVQGKLKIRDEASPVILELSIVDVTNPTDPSAILVRIQGAQLLAKTINRRVLMYVDEAHISTPIVRNAIKSFLTQKILKEENQVHLGLSTTSSEARDFLSDTAFSRRFSDLFVREFNKQETIALIKQAYLPLWIRNHRTDDVQFDGVTDDGFEYAYTNALFEQAHAGNPTGTKELLEGAITREIRLRRANGQRGRFTVDVDQIREYIKSALNQELLPGDPNFDTIFDLKWEAFRKAYTMEEGFEIELKKAMRRYFATLTSKRKMDAWVFFGPPGAGKSYLLEMLSKYFFGGKSSIETINGGEFKNGGLELNKLIGSPPGTVGSEQQRSRLTKFIADNPNGGFMLVEEADYAHQDITQFFTNMISGKEFADGLGKMWRTDRYILAETSNIGQDLMIPPDAANSMNWTQYEARRSQIMESVELEDGRTVERVRQDVLKQVFGEFISKIVTSSHPMDDTSGVAQEANKQMRRYTAFYLVPPKREQLREAAQNSVASFIEKSKFENRVTFDIPSDVVDELIDLDHYDFAKGHSYVAEQLEPKLYDILASYMDRKNQTVSVRVEKQVGEDEKARLTLLVEVGGEVNRHEIVSWVGDSKNPWAASPEMRARINSFAGNMHKGLKGNSPDIMWMKDGLKLKLINWNTPVVLTKLGTTGNGKTEFFRQAALALFDDERALIPVTPLNNKFQLANHFRPPTGIQGGKEETETERRIKSRAKAGGGILLFDELLSIDGLDGHAMSNRMEVLNELYELLDTGWLRIGNKLVDCRMFIIGVTGNFFQKYFTSIPDDPVADAMVKRILEKLTQNEITKGFGAAGIDPPKLARFGRISVSGPLNQDEARLAGELMIAKEIDKAKKELGRNVEVEVDPAVVAAVISRVKTVKLGMRNVNSAFRLVVAQPLAGIVSDIPQVKAIAIRVGANGELEWFVNGKPAVKQGMLIEGTSDLYEENWVYTADLSAGARALVPQITDIPDVEKTQLSPDALKVVAYHEVMGHWAVGTMLTGKNADSAISLIPDEGHGGYVWHKDDKEIKWTTLSSSLAQMAMLEAGHRAPIVLLGIYAGGGGTSDTKAKNRNDDISKINRLIDYMLNNQFLSGYRENSPMGRKRIFTEVVSRFAIDMADYLVEKADKSGEFAGPLQTAIQQRFIGETELDATVANMDWTRMGSPELNLMEAAVYAGEKYRTSGIVSKAGTNLIANIVAQLASELPQKAESNPAMHAQIEAIARKFAQELTGDVANGDPCEKKLTGRKKKTS